MQVIRGIADQTNLLALNAAIEGSARGRAGPGVLPLSPTRCASWRSALRVRPARSASSSMRSRVRPPAPWRRSRRQRHGAKWRGTGRSRVEFAWRHQHGARQTMDNVACMATAIEQQSREAEGGFEHVRQIIDMVGRNSREAESTLAEAQGLKSLAANLHEISNVFRLGVAGEARSRCMSACPRWPRRRPGDRQVARRSCRGARPTCRDCSATATSRSPTPARRNTRPPSMRLPTSSFPKVQEPLLENNPHVVYAIGCDRRGYVPTPTSVSRRSPATTIPTSSATGPNASSTIRSAGNAAAMNCPS